MSLTARSSEEGARCGSTARRDLQGGLPATGGPTLTHKLKRQKAGQVALVIGPQQGFSVTILPYAIKQSCLNLRSSCKINFYIRKNPKDAQ